MRTELKESLEGLLEALPLIIDLPNNRKTFNDLIASEEGMAIKDILENSFIGHGYQNLNEIHKKLTSVKNEVLDAVLDCFPPKTAGWKIAQQVDTILSQKETPNTDKYCDNLTLRLAQRNQEDNTILNISSMLKVDSSALTTNKLAGANKGCIFTDPDGEKHFIKGFSNDAKQETAGKLDPNEAFVYKVMEHMGLGPETAFLIRNYSTGRGTATPGNYIMTKDVCTPTYLGEEKSFFLDEAENKELYLEALKDRTLNIELSTLSTVNDLMVLGDTFGDNPKNYGIVKSMGEQGTRYSAMVVDHLPNSNNAEFPPLRFAKDEPYSPRTSIQKRIESPRYDRDDIAITKLSQGPAALDEGKKSFATEIIKSDVSARVATLPEALERAKIDVETLITEHNRSFVDNSKERLGAYVAKIKENFSIYQGLESNMKSGSEAKR